MPNKGRREVAIKREENVFRITTLFTTARKLAVEKGGGGDCKVWGVWDR